MPPILIEIEDRFINPSKRNDLGDFFQNLTPTLKAVPSFYTKEYFSPFNLVFLQSISNQELFQLDHVFLVRDGLCELVKFFISWPSPPKGSQAKFLFPLDFESFIPTPWKKISASYHYQETRPTLLSEKSGLIFFGHITPEGVDFDFLQSAMNVIKDKTKLFGLFENQIRYTPFYYSYQSKSMECIHRFFSQLPQEIQHLEKRSLYGMGLTHDWQMLDIDFYDFHVYDKWISHFMKGMGTKSLGGRMYPVNEKDLVLPLSPFESIHINSWTESYKDHFKELFLESKLIGLAPESFYRAFGEHLSDMNKSGRSKELKIFGDA